MLRLFKYSLIQKNARIEDILDLTINDFLERRLQTIVFKKNLSKSIKQARQFITHGHIFIESKKVTIPSYFVAVDEENKITYNPKSTLSKEGHPELMSHPQSTL